MSEIEFRMGEKRFYDDKAFPRGFAKSGNFTLLEEELLIYYGDTMLGLESGKLLPENGEEEHFMEVLADPEKAASKLEKAWLKYIKHARGRKHFHTLNSRKSSVEQSLVELDDSDDNIDTFADD